MIDSAVKRWGLTALFAFALLLLSATAEAIQLGFENITSNTVADAAIGEAQLFVDVTDLGGGQIQFHFTNIGPDASSITDVYFDDRGGLLSSPTVTNSSGVSFSLGASPGNLPGGNDLSPSFQATAGLSSDSNPPTQPNGVNPGEYLDLRFVLAGGTFDDLLADLGDGQLRIGIHVQGFADGGSESFVNAPPPSQVPEPSGLLLIGSGLAAFGLFGRAAFRKG